MTRSRVLVFLSVFAAGLIAGVPVPALGGAAGSKVTNLLREELATDFTPDREVLVDLVEIPSNQELDWHWHPGEEVHCYSKGTR
jgi:quercetin dioxygenase-like cupin family protein